MRFAGVFALAVALLWLVPVAQAVPPGNDNFADAESLGVGLPVTVGRTNVEATKEAGEFHSFFASDESVWFEWEAEVTGFVTASVCDSDFKPIVAIYTGDTLGSLVKTVDGNGDGSPGCPSGEWGVTFEAESGTSYKIAVTADSFYLPEAPRPVTAGEFELRLAATPLPANDDFHDAATLLGRITTEPGGARRYVASQFGYNWMATKEASEPEHGSDQGGASVWYSWTPPEGGLAYLSVCCAPSSSIGIYEGASVSGLTRVAPSTNPPLGAVFPVSGGTTYRIAIDGKFAAGSGSIDTGSFNLLVMMDLLPEPDDPPVFGGRTQPAVVAPDIIPPQTSASRRVLKREPPVVVVNFGSSETGSTFRCGLDKRRYTPCRSPKRLKNLAPGRHTFRVVATDAAGNADPTPAKVNFRIPESTR